MASGWILKIFLNYITFWLKSFQTPWKKILNREQVFKTWKKAMKKNLNQKNYKNCSQKAQKK